MPEILALGGGARFDGVGATLMKFLAERTASRQNLPPPLKWQSLSICLSPKLRFGNGFVNRRFG